MITLIILPYLQIQLARSDVPDLLKTKEFNSAGLTRAANHYIKRGEESFLNDIKLMALDPGADFRQGFGASNQMRTNFSQNERIGWLCRVLYEPKETKPLRPPGLGALGVPYMTMPSDSWPLFPL